MASSGSFVESAQSYGAENCVYSPSMVSLQGVGSALSYWVREPESERRVKRLFLDMHSRNCERSAYALRWMSEKTIRLLGDKIEKMGTLRCLRALQIAWCQTNDLQKKAIFEQSAQKVLKRQSRSFPCFWVELLQQKVQALQEKIGEGKKGVYQRIKKLRSLMSKRDTARARAVVETFSNVERKIAYRLLDDPQVRRLLLLENIRRAVLIACCPQFRSAEIENALFKSEKEVIAKSADVVEFGLIAYSGLEDVVEVLEDLVERPKLLKKSSFDEFFLRWVERHKEFAEYKTFLPRLEHIACRLGIEERFYQKSSPKLQRPRLEFAASRKSSTYFDVRRVLSSFGNKGRKQSVGFVAEDLRVLSTRLFQKASFSRLALGHGLPEITRFFNKLSDLITYTTLYDCEGDLRRAQRIGKYWLRVALESFQKRDFASCGTIINTLSSAHLYRLFYKGSECLVKNFDETFSRLSALFSPQGAHKTYRRHEKRIQGGYVPFTPVLAQDMLFMRESSPNFGGGGFPPIIHIAGKAIRRMEELKRHDYGSLRRQMSNTSLVIQSADSLLRRACGGDERALYAVSLALRSNG